MTTTRSNDFSEDELAGLSEEERLAVTEDAEEAPPVGDPAPEPDKTPSDEQKPEQDGDAPVPEDAKPEFAEEKPQGQQPKPFVPQFSFQSDFDSAKADETLKGLDEGIAKVREGYRDGEIGEADFYNKLTELMDQKNSLNTQRAMADYSDRMSKQFNQQSQEQLWQYEQRLFFDQHPLYKDDLVHRSAIQGVFANLDADKNNANKTGLELLHEARQIVEQSRFGGQQEPQQQPVQTKGKVPAIEKSPPPQTLAFAPQADRNSVEKDDFAHLDNMDGIELERALSKMSGDQAERYLRVGMAT